MISPIRHNVETVTVGRRTARLVSDGWEITYRTDDGTTHVCPEFGYGVFVSAKSIEDVAKSRQEAYRMLALENTGSVGNPEDLRKRVLETETLRSQSHEICRRLELVGIDGYIKGGPKMYVYYVHTRSLVELPRFRHICLIPTAAAAMRAKMVLELGAFQEANDFLRMWTLTSGLRCKLTEVRERLGSFHDDQNEFRKWLRRKYGIEILFSATEFGTPETYDGNGAVTNAKSSGLIERDENDEVTLHVHAHTLVDVKQRRSKDDWIDLLADVQAHWPHMMQDGGQIVNPRELVKYITKPGEMLKLKPEELGELFRQTKDMKLMRPLGRFKEERAARKKREMKLVRKQAGNGEGYIFQEVPDWNKAFPLSEIEKADKKFRAHLKTWPVEQQIALFWASLNSGCVDLAIKLPLEERDAATLPLSVVAKLAPSFAPGSLVSEPRLVVMGDVWSRDALERSDLVNTLREETRDAWDSGVALASIIKVHTCTLTGEQRTLGLWEFEPPDHPPDEVYEHFEPDTTTATISETDLNQLNLELAEMS